MTDPSDPLGKPSWVSTILQRFRGPSSGTSIQSIAWNVLVAGLAIGGGYLAIRFTDGEEEFCSPEEMPNMLMGRRMAPIVPHRLQQSLDQQNVEDTVEVEDLEDSDMRSESYDDQGRHLLNSTMMGGDGSLPMEEGGDRYFGDTGMQPSWVDELLEKLEQVDSKLDEIKTAMNDGSSKAPIGHDLNTDDSVAKITDFYKIDSKEAESELAQFESAMQKARDALCLAANRKSENKKSLDEGLSALRMYVNMIVENPDIPRYRRIATSNQSFRTLIAPIEGHDTFLKCLGFMKKSSCYEWLDTVTNPSGSSTNGEDVEPKGGNDEASSDPPDISKLSHESRLKLLKKGLQLL